MPYKFSHDTDLNLLIQARDPALLNTLHLMYQQDSNIGFLQDGHTLSTGYGDDFFRVIREVAHRFNIATALEIGCGGCYLLEKLSALGIDALGIDPSPVAHHYAAQKHIPIIDDFYPSKALSRQFDLIYHVDVLEHVSNPVEFLTYHLDNLTTNGLILVNIPDNSRSIELGDISLATHQHLNNFDELSLFNTLVKSGYKVIDIIKSGFGGSLYGLATPATSSVSASFKPSFSDKLVADFFGKSSANILRFTNLVHRLLDLNLSLGFYMPLRAFPYLSAAGILNKVRLFDDISHWHNAYIGSSSTPIENFEDLCNQPPDYLFIMSHTFGHGLRQKISSNLPDQKILLLSDFLCDTSFTLDSISEL